ncbi:hypothetical protein F2Q69_00047237 [Brassica cretica]|uniref:Thioredoxin domain-containing protein n=1 Tax=Brassica cretica TaxID=69181 RepID=A0A8S9PXQ4_BRACR|nr:hypothetical protein F2Q69_00047237 [Brassica cretica]
MRSLVMSSDELPVLVQFTADECKQCRCMDFRLENLDVRYAGRIKFYKMDIHKAPVIAKKIHVTTVPTSIIFRGGGIMGEVLGYNPAKAFVSDLAPPAVAAASFSRLPELHPFVFLLHVVCVVFSLCCVLLFSLSSAGLVQRVSDPVQIWSLYCLSSWFLGGSAA